MKKSVLILALAFAAFSCSKKETDTQVDSTDTISADTMTMPPVEPDTMSMPSATDTVSTMPSDTANTNR